MGELNGALAGQVAVITGQKDVSAAAKVVKNFSAEFDKLKVKSDTLNQQMELLAQPVTKLTDAQGLRPWRLKISAEAHSLFTSSPMEEPPRQKSRTVSRNLSFHSAQPGGNSPT